MSRHIRRGSLSIFFCLVLGATAAVFTIFLQAAQLRSVECDLDRAMSAQIRANLAAYDRTAREFGLFGFAAASVNHSVFTGSLPTALQSFQLQSELLAPMTDPSVLDRQIIRYMKGRLPAAYLSLLAQRLAQMGNCLSGPALSGQSSSQGVGQRKSKMMSQSQTDDAAGLKKAIETLTGNLQSDDIKNAADGLFGGIFDQLKNQAMLKLQNMYRQYAAELLGVESKESITGILGQIPDFLDPDVMSALAGHLDLLLNFTTAPVYEKCCLVEYVLGHFRPAAEQLQTANGLQDLRTIDGRLFKSLPETRQAEAEQIITGLCKPESACLAVRAIITSLRSLIHVAALLSDQERISAIRTAAAGTSAAIAAMTAGTVVVDPEILVYLQVIGQSIGSGISDYNHLASGQAVRLWPGKSKFKLNLYYQDYLRLFLLILPRSTILIRTGNQLERILQHPCYTKMQVRITYHKKSYSLCGGYQ